MKTSRVIIRMAEAVGIASSAPTTPSSPAPASAAITVTEPGMSTPDDGLDRVARGLRGLGGPGRVSS